MKKVLTVIGTRPNIIKISQFERAFAPYSAIYEHWLVYTNQHYDRSLSTVFFEELGIGEPDSVLKYQSANPAEQIGQIIIQLQKEMIAYRPDLVIVVGDVNSTLAAAIAADKLSIPVAHLESGLRSFDRSMPEEVNRVIVDQIASLFFVTEKSGLENLEKEGLKNDHTYFVGNTMIDTLVALEPKIDESPILRTLGIDASPYALLTMHRPSNVDHRQGLLKLVELLENITKKMPVVFPLHPRTKKNLKEENLLEHIEKIPGLKLTGPLGYLDFQKLIKESTLVLTDSGGIQEETTYRKVPCLTIRENTERPVTIDLGTNQLVEFEPDSILKKVEKITTSKPSEIPPNWDGKASVRIAKVLADYFQDH